MVPKIALACGILAPLLFVATDLLAGLQSPAYNFIRTSISELSAFGAPTRAYVLPLLITQSLLLATFGVGIWLQAEQNISLRVIAALLVADAAVSLVAVSLFPMHSGVRPSPQSVTVILGATEVVLVFVAMGFGAAAFTNWFRIYSIGNLVVFGVLTVFGLVVQGGGRVGLQERVIAYAFQLWILLLAILLLTAEAALGRGSESAVS